MHRPLSLSVLLILVIGDTLMSQTSSTHSATTQIDLSGMKPGLAPEDFAFSRTGSGDVGEWRVVDDPTESNRRVIAQTSKDSTHYRFPLAVYQRVSVKNVDVKMRFKPVDGKVDQAGGMSPGSPRRTTITSSVPMLSKTMSDSIAWSRGSGNSLTARTSKSPPTNGTHSGCGLKMTGSQSRLMENNYSRPWTAPSPKPERWASGPKPTV